MMFSTFSLNLLPSSDTMVESVRNQITDALRKEHLEQPDLRRAALIAHIDAAAQRHTRVFAAEDR